MRSLLQAARRGQIAIESTGNEAGTYYHRLCVRAFDPTSRWKLHFFNWLRDPNCSTPFEDDAERESFQRSLDETLEEPALLSSGLRLDQIQWRRATILDEFDGDISAFKTEYPISFDDCFQTGGFRFFRKVNYVPTDQWKRESVDLCLLEGHPRSGEWYAIGADVGNGVGRNYSVGEIYSLKNLEQVGEWRSNRKEPDQFGLALAELGKRFNEAYINVERNNTGIMAIRSLIDNYPIHLVHRSLNNQRVATDRDAQRLSTYGTYTQNQSREYMLGVMKQALSTKAIIHSPILFNEIQTFTEHDDGMVKAADGCYDDCVMASATMFAILGRARLRVVSDSDSDERNSDPFSMESIIEELEAKFNGRRLRKEDMEYPNVVSLD
jgi:hypothetical protein